MSSRPPDDDHTRVDPPTGRNGDEGPGRESGAPEQIGPYRLLELLGSGGMGEVYLAEQLEPVQRQVALKLIGGKSRRGVASAYFEVERQMLAQMQHPYIAQVYDAGTDEDGRPWFAMEWVPGEPLTDYCHRKDLDREARIRLFMRVCQGVQHAHHRGIIHRDLKPANVLVAEVDREHLPKVIDFGVATSVMEGEGIATASSPDRAGTRAYMSPEQRTGESGQIDTRTDVYALGVMLFELLTERRPPDSSRTDELASFWKSLTSSSRSNQPALASSDEDLQASVEGATRLDRELRCILSRALAPNREDRYESPDALARDLRAYLEDEVVDAVPSTRAYRWRKFLLRNRVPVAAGAVVSLALVAGLAVALWSLVQVQDERDRAEAQAERAEQTSSFVTRMLSSINPDYADGADTTLLRRVLDDAADRAKSGLAGQRRIRAEILFTIGKTYLAIGELDASREHLETVIALSSDDPGLESLHLDARERLARLDLREGRFESALSDIEQLQTEAGAVLEPNDPVSLDIGATRAALLQRVGRLDEAKAQIESVIERTRGHEDDAIVEIRIDAMRSLAQIHSDGQELEQAHAVYGELRDQIEAWDDPAARRHRLMALNDHAVVYLRQQRYADAEPLLRQSIEGQKGLYGEGHPYTMQSIGNMGGSLRQQGRPDEALPYYREAAELAREHLGMEHPNTLIAMFNLGNCYRDLDDPERAVEIQREVLAGAKEHAAGNTFMLGIFHLGLGRSELAAGNPAGAEALLSEAVALLTEAAGAEHYRTEEAAEYLGRAREVAGSDAAAGSP